MRPAELVAPDELDFESYAAFHQEAFRELLRRTRVSGDFLTAGYYRWKYHPPAGRARVGLVRDEQGICSASGLVPFVVENGRERVVGWHSLDAATAPRARRKGLFVSCLRVCQESLGTADLLFSFPNASSLPSFRKLGCHENHVVTTWITPLTWLLRRQDPDVVPVERLTWAPELPPGGIRLLQDVAYLNWRYVDHPTSRYLICQHPEGLLVLRTARVMGLKAALVMELLSADPRVRWRLLRHAAEWAASEGCPGLVMLNTETSLLEGLRTGWVPLPARLLPKRQVLVNWCPGPATRPLGFGRWRLQTGDWDSF